MLRAVAVKPDIYWVGAIDWNDRNFHGYAIERGTTYNAYLIMDEKITLIDTVNRPFANELMERVSDIVDPAKIDYLISNHVEMDHSGCIPIMMEAAKNATLVTGAPQGLNGLKAHYGDHFNFLPVKTSDTLNIGKRTLSFVQTPMVHWPDNMVTYSETDKVLFSNDAFGQHLASSKRFDDEVDLSEALDQARKYYANIVMPYGANVQRALKAVEGLDIDIIAPAHGVIWRSHVSDILERYQLWSSDPIKDYAVVVYDSMWHTTESMALEIAEAFMECGIPMRLFDLKVNHISEIMAELLSAKYVAVGSPTLNLNMMPTVASFLCYMRGLSPKNSGRVGIPFGSYGWVPAGPNQIAEILEACGYEMPFGTLTHQWVEDEQGLDELHQAIVSGLKKLQA